MPSTELKRETLPDARLGGPGLRTFLKIANEWELSSREQAILLGTPESTFYAWKKDAIAGKNLDLRRDTLERLSYILGIYKALVILLPMSSSGWIKRPNDAPLFGGKPALTRMLSGNVADLFVVRQYLDAWRGGWA